LANQLAALRDAALAGPRTRATVVVQLALIQLWRGDLRAARRLLESQEATTETTEAYQESATWGLLLEEEGAAGEALRRYQYGASPTADPVSLQSQAGIARTAIALHYLPAARTARNQIEELSGHGPGLSFRDEVRAWVAVGEERTEDAAYRFGAAAESSSHAYDAARLNLEAARLTGDRAGIEAAILAFDQMGALRAADRARAVARAEPRHASWPAHMSEAGC
jgi:hypothetical protein